MLSRLFLYGIHSVKDWPAERNDLLSSLPPKAALSCSGKTAWIVLV
ncbi:MAG: hypothetical protein AB7H80_02300 [Candidatus Kapaibacterium sp.]